MNEGNFLRRTRGLQTVLQGSRSAYGSASAYICCYRAVKLPILFTGMALARSQQPQALLFSLMVHDGSTLGLAGAAECL